jgi:chromosome segregation ATPase
LNVRNQEIEDANDVLSKTSTLLEDSKSLIARLQVELEQEKNKVEEEQKKYRTSYAKYYAEVKKLNSISAEKDFEITQLNKNITRFKGAWNEAEEKVKRREKYADIIRKERYTYKTNNDVLQSQNSRLAGQVDDLRNQVNENAQQSQNLQELQSKHSIDLEQLREEYEHELAQEVDKTESLHAKFMEETGFLRLKLTAVEGEAQMLRSREALAQGQMKTEKNGLASAKKRKPSEAVTIDGTSPDKKSKEGEHVSDGKVSVKGYWIMMDGVPKWVEPYERKKPEWKKKGTNDPEENAEKEVSQELGKNP